MSTRARRPDWFPTWLTALIPQDYTYLSAGPKEAAPVPLKGNQDRPFDPKGSTGQRNPAKGFLTIRKEVVEALRAQPGMRWGGTDFGAANGDIMHFDLGKVWSTPVRNARDAAQKGKDAGPAPAVQRLPEGMPIPVQRHEMSEEDIVEDTIINPR
jgi:hypothetical protein